MHLETGKETPCRNNTETWEISPMQNSPGRAIQNSTACNPPIQWTKILLEAEERSSHNSIEWQENEKESAHSAAAKEVDC